MAPRAGPEFRSPSITTSKDRATEEERKAKGPIETGFGRGGLVSRHGWEQRMGGTGTAWGGARRLLVYRLPGCRVSYPYLFIQESGNCASWTSMKLQPK